MSISTREGLLKGTRSELFPKFLAYISRFEKSNKLRIIAVSCFFFYLFSEIKSPHLDVSFMRDIDLRLYDPEFVDINLSFMVDLKDTSDGLSEQSFLEGSLCVVAESYSF